MKTVEQSIQLEFCFKAPTTASFNTEAGSCQVEGSAFNGCDKEAARREKRSRYMRDWREKHQTKLNARNRQLYAERLEQKLSEDAAAIQQIAARHGKSVLWVRYQKARYYAPTKSANCFGLWYLAICESRRNAKRQRIREYLRTEQGKSRRKRYLESEKGRERARDYARLPERIARNKKYQRSDAYKARLYARWKHRREVYVQFAVAGRLRVRLAMALSRSRGQKSAATVALLGCPFAEFIIYLEAHFLPGMTWENRNQWHIDHIIPCWAFDLRHEAEQKRCFHFSNLRPLWKSENLAKSNKMTGPRQLPLL